MNTWLKYRQKQWIGENETSTAKASLLLVFARFFFSFLIYYSSEDVDKYAVVFFKIIIAAGVELFCFVAID